MTEVYELRPVRSLRPNPIKTHTNKFNTFAIESDSSDETIDSDDEQIVFLELPSKFSRKTTASSLPVIVNSQSIKEKHRRRNKQSQQVFFNTQKISSTPKEKDIIIQQFIEPRLKSNDNHVTAYFHSDHASNNQRDSSKNRSVHLPRHSKQVVNRFLSQLENAHANQNDDGNDSDYNIYNCQVCRQTRSLVDNNQVVSGCNYCCAHHHKELLLNDSHRHARSNDCDICSVIDSSNIVVTHKNHHHSRKRHRKQKHPTHVVKNKISANQPSVETKVTTTVNEQKPGIPNVPMINPSVPVQSMYNPWMYSNYADPNTGLSYVYNPNLQSASYSMMPSYDYLSYNPYPYFFPNYPPYPAYNLGKTVSRETVSQPIYQYETSTVNPTISKTGPYIYEDDDDDHRYYRSERERVIVRRE